MNNLENHLLKISTNEIDEFQLDQKFDNIATGILQKTILVAGDVRYAFNEVEIYFYGAHYKHLDPYVHRNPRQSQFGEWYFHRFKNSETYKNQKFRGIDITFGNETNLNYGGILIRSVLRIHDQTNIKGIGNIAGEILSQIGDNSFQNLAFSRNKSAFDLNSPLHLEEQATSDSTVIIYKTGRVLPDSDRSLDYYSKFYRYLNDPKIKIVQHDLR